MDAIPFPPVGEIEYLDMTVGMVVSCREGFLAVSDSAAIESTWTFRSQFPRAKTGTIGQCVVAYAGNGDLCKGIVQRASANASDSSDPSEIARILSSVARKTRKPARAKNAQFIVAGFDNDGNRRMYYLTNNDRFTSVDRSEEGFAFVGKWPVANYYMTRYLAPGMDSATVARLCALAISETAAVLEGVDARPSGVLAVPGKDPQAFDFSGIMPALLEQELRLTSVIHEWISSNSATQAP